jgi:uncharacterized membrane protein SpoIIM required for sporulation
VNHCKIPFRAKTDLKQNYRALPLESSDKKKMSDIVTTQIKCLGCVQLVLNVSLILNDQILFCEDAPDTAYYLRINIEMQHLYHQLCMFTTAGNAIQAAAMMATSNISFGLLPLFC